MVAINFNLTNFNNVARFMNIFNGFDNDFEITSDGVLRQKKSIDYSEIIMSHIKPFRK